MIREIISTSLPAIAREKGFSDLGDRSRYIGASDVGQCPRKTIMGKLFPQPITIEQQLVFERGHLAENIIHESLLHYCSCGDNQKVSAQVEVCYPNEPNIKAHIDFVLEDNDNGVKTVIEVKTASMVTTPYDSWVEQTIFQQGLLKLVNPDFTVEGYVLCLDLKTGNIAEFPVEYDESVFQNLIERAKYLLSLLENENLDLENIPQKQSILCGYCAFQADCPAYADKGNIPDELKALIREYSSINIAKKEIDKKLDGLKEVITSYGPFRANVDGIKASYAVSSMMSLDIKALKANEPELAEMYSSPKEVGRLLIG